MLRPKLLKRQQAKEDGHFIDYFLLGIVAVMFALIAVVFITYISEKKVNTHTNCAVENVTSTVNIYQDKGVYEHQYTTSCGNFFEHEKASMGVGYTYNIKTVKIDKEVHEVELLSDLK